MARDGNKEGWLRLAQCVRRGGGSRSKRPAPAPLAGNKQEGARMSHSGSPFEDKSGAISDGRSRQGRTSLAAGTKFTLINRTITKQTERRPVFSSKRGRYR